MRLRELRRAKHMTQSQLATEFKVAQNTISQWENGERELAGTVLLQLADFFDVTTDYIIGREQKENPVAPEKEQPVNLLAIYLAQRIVNLSQKDFNRVMDYVALLERPEN